MLSLFQVEVTGNILSVFNFQKQGVQLLETKFRNLLIISDNLFIVVYLRF